MPFKIIRNDITKVSADAIVNTANPNAAYAAGVDSAIYNAAGKEALLEERKKIGPLEPGDAALTAAFNLDARYIIHVAGPRWNGGGSNEAALLRQCYDKALHMAAENDCTSIAFPLLSTGTYGFPKKLGIQIAVDAFTDFLKDYEMEITLAVFGSDAVKISGELVDEVSSFVDDAYVDQTLEKEYESEVLMSSSAEPMQSPWHADKSKRTLRSVLGTGLKGFVGKGTGMSARHEASAERSAGPEAFEEASAGNAPAPEILEDASPMAMAAPASLDEAIEGIYTDSLEKHLRQLINKKGLKNSEVYSAANISKQYFSKLLKGKVKPSKEKMLALVVGLRLNMDEAVDFMRIGGYAFSPISQTDVVVEYFIRHEDYNVMKIDIVLFDYGLDPLS